ncbi:type II secretion system F family protein [Acidiferrobacter sp.]|uniref:type II secretion system F family protein n=1 Tax=Acidiferrobacter sp. TaxID=1872107 RepID=UPI00260C3BC6|nr:type II secretion system F family protein [Acidiferrobacter sp.]
MATAVKGADRTAVRKKVGPKASVFQWQARPAGDAKAPLQKGELEAASAAVVRVILRKRGLQVVSVKKKPKPLFAGTGGIKEAGIVVMIRQLSTMINAGVPMVQAFELLAAASEGRGMKAMLEGILGPIKEGERVADAFARYPKYFDRLFVSLLAAGDQGGILDTILLRLADYREKSLALQKKIRSAMIYPASIITVMLLVTAILMIFVIPVFSQLFSSFGATLPALTQAVIAISNWMRGHWYLVVFIPIAVVWAFIVAYRKSFGFRTQVDRISLKLPIMGDVILKGSVARFMRTLATMQAAGVPINEALETLSRISNNVIIERAVNAARERVLEGGFITDSLKETGVFPAMAVHMLAIGEQTGAIEVMAEKVADFYEGEVTETVARMSTLMEPIIMVVLGIIVGTLVVAMYMPIFELGAVVTHGG